LYGAEASDKAFKGALAQDRSEQSAGVYFGKITKLAKADHSSCVNRIATIIRLIAFAPFVNGFEKKFVRTCLTGNRRLTAAAALELRPQRRRDAREKSIGGITSTGTENFYEVSDDWHNAVIRCLSNWSVTDQSQRGSSERERSGPGIRTGASMKQPARASINRSATTSTAWMRAN